MTARAPGHQGSASAGHPRPGGADSDTFAIVRRDWAELDVVEHAVAWLDREGRPLRENAAYRLRRGGRPGIEWLGPGEPRGALATAIFQVSTGVREEQSIEIATLDDRWEQLNLVAMKDRPGSVLIEIQDVTRRRLEERRLAAETSRVRALVGIGPSIPRHAPAPSGRLAAPPWVARAAASEAPALIVGERGAGKSFAARQIHYTGSRAAEPFIEICCEGMTGLSFARDVLGQELGGPRTGPSAIERARTGSLHLDRADELDEAAQALLAAALGSTSAGEVRWILSTSASPTEVKARELASWLADHARLVVVRVPSLRERAAELPELATAMLKEVSSAVLTPDALQALQARSWPGNLRDLSRTLSRASLAAERRARMAPFDGPACIGEAEIAMALRTRPSASPEEGSLSARERSHIDRVVAETQFNLSRASEVLGISRSTLYKKLSLYGIEVPRRTAKTRS